MALFRANRQNPEITDETQPDEPLEAADGGGTAVVPNDEAAPQEADAFSDEDLDALYDEEGNSFYVNDAGEAVDGEGNPIPATRSDAATRPVETVQAEEEAPVERPRVNYRSPMTTLLTDEEKLEAEELADPRIWSMFDKMARRAALQEASARDQQKAAARSLGIRAELQDEIGAKMSQVEHLVPAEMRGTKQGANTALLIAALQEAGEDGDVFSVMNRWGTGAGTPPKAQPIPQVQQVVPAPQPRRNVPIMPPSARTTIPRSAPESVRTNRPAKEIGGLSQSELAIIQMERNTVKNGR